MFDIRDLPLEMIGRIAAGIGGVFAGEWLEDEIARTGNTWFSPDPTTSAKYATLITGALATVGGIAGFMKLRDYGTRYISSLVAFGGGGILANGLKDTVMNAASSGATVTAVRVPAATKREPVVAPRAESVISIK